MPRQMIAIHRNNPTISRICHSRGRSRYSHCWENNPPVGDHPVDGQRLADQRAEHHHRDRAEQHVRQQALTARLAAGDERHQEDAAGQKRRRSPEQRQLHVPGPGQVVRQHPGQIQAEERRQVGPVVLGGRAQQRLRQEQHRHDREEPDGGPLGRRQAHLAGLAERQRGRLGAVPADLLAPPAVDGEHDPDAAEQRDQRQRRPHDHRRGRTVVDPRLGRPVVGVAVVVAGAFGRGLPTPSTRRTPSGRGFAPCR